MNQLLTNFSKVGNGTFIKKTNAETKTFWTAKLLHLSTVF